MSDVSPPADYRQRLINALAVVISRDGYGGAKIQDIVREAKVSLRTFYAEFPNKEECFLALYEQVGAVVDKLIVDAVTFEDSWYEEIRKGFRAHLLALQSAPRLTYAVLVELATLSDHARETRQNSMERLVRLVCDQVEQGRAIYTDVPSRSVSPLMVRAMMGGVTEMIVDLVVRDEYDRLPDLVDAATDLMWSVVTNVTDPATLGSGGPVNPPKRGDKTEGSSPETGVRR